MENLRVDEEPAEVHASSDPSQTRDDSVKGRGRGVISASLGAMRPLIAKLDELLLAHHSDGMRLLSNDVKKIRSYVDELSEVEDTPRTAECWMNEARDLSYDMEDYIDNIIYMQTAGASAVFKDMEADKQIVTMVSDFSNYAQEVIERYKAYVLPSSSSLRRRPFLSFGPMRPTYFEDIVIDGRMEEFINSFAKDGDKQLKVVSVLGSAGLGKTTLARELYNKLGKLYHCRAFVRVSRKPDMSRIFRDMVWQLQRQEPPGYRNEPDLIGNIKKYLLNKRYLIIVDDVWAASVWDTINDALPTGSHGSRIVTTTQIEDVALTCCCHQSELVFEMKPLDDEHSRELFFNRLFGSESNCPEIFREVSNKIVETCDGLPFATISIASLLASQPVITEDLLERIHKSLSFCFSVSSSSERTRQALNLSFNNLPQYLKTCLLYLSMRREGYIFCKDDLVKQWMAEGFSHTIEEQDAEKVVESYLHQLIGRRFIQPIRISYNNDVLSCAVHDTVHDLIAHKSAEMNFIVAIDHSQKNVALSHKARRLSLLFGDARYAKTPENITKSQVRSLAFVGLLECMPCITEFKLLCVLNLQVSGHGGNDDLLDLSGISELFQLTYLKIASDVCVKLPKHGLQCLETLDITDARVAVDGLVLFVPHIPLPHLLHLSLSDQIKLLNWVHILVSDGKLKYLQDIHITTPSTSASYDLESIMINLRSIIGSSPHKLKTVVVYHGSSVKKDVVLRPYEVADTWNDVILPPLLQKFEFMTQNRIMFSRIPPSVEKHGNLSILKIEVRDLDMSCVDILRELPSLTALSLRVKIAPIQRVVFDKAGFSILRYFKLRFTSGIAWLNFEAHAMPNLWKLKLVFDSIPQMDRELVLYSSHPLFEQHKHGTEVISIEHMPGLKEISVKFGGAATDIKYALRIGVSNHKNNPTINKKPKQDRSEPKQEQNDNVDEEVDRSHKPQLGDNLGEELDEQASTLERPADTSIPSSSEPSRRLHVSGSILCEPLDSGEIKESQMRMTLMVDRNSRLVYAEAGKDVVDYLFYLLTLPLCTVVKLLKDFSISMVGSVGTLYESVENLDNTYMSYHEAKHDLLRPTAKGNPGRYVNGRIRYMVMDNLEVTPPSTITAISTLMNTSRINIGSLQRITVILDGNERRQILKASLRSSTVLTDVFLRKTSRIGGP